MSKIRLDFEIKYKKYLVDERGDVMIWFDADKGEYVNHRVFWDADVGFVNGLWVEFKENQNVP